MTRRRIESPYVGLVPYTEEDSRFFFGREDDLRIIISNLFASRLTILYGSSGVGKSSVLRAGAIRELRDRGEKALAEGRSPDVAVVYFNDWKSDALSALKRAIGAALGANHSPVVASIAKPTLRQIIEDCSARFDGDLMVIFDQFEEYFLYHPLDLMPGSFAHEFAEAANCPQLPVSFMVALRDDALSRLDRFKTLIPNLFSNYLRIRHLTREQARNAILLPIDAYNQLPEDERVHTGMVSIEPDVVEKILDGVRQDRVIFGEIGRGVLSGTDAKGIETPYLQLVLKRMWTEELSSGSRQLRAATLDRLGGAEEIVGSHLAGVLNRLTDAEKEICSRMFQFLVTPGGTKIAHAMSDLADFAKVSEADLAPILEKLSGSESRILSPVASIGAEGPMRFEIYHDSLAHAILEWRKAYVTRKEKEEQERVYAAEAERQKKELEQAQLLAAAQRERADLQTQNSRRLRRLLIVLAALLGLVVLVAAYAWNQRVIAKRNEDLAIRNERRALVSEKLAQERELEAQKARAQAAAAGEAFARAVGNQGEAEKFRKVADEAKAEAQQLQQKSARDVGVVLEAQRTAKDAILQRERLEGELAETRAELVRMRSVQYANNPKQVVDRPASELTVFIRLSGMQVIQDGLRGPAAWNFFVSSQSRDLISIPRAEYDDTQPYPISIGREARLPAREGTTIPITIRGSAPDGTVVEGAYSVFVKPLPQFLPETVRIPVIDWQNPAKGSFVAIMEIKASGPTAK